MEKKLSEHDLTMIIYARKHLDDAIRITAEDLFADDWVDINDC